MLLRADTPVQIPAELITVDPHQLTALDDADQETLEKEKLEAKVC